MEGGWGWWASLNGRWVGLVGKSEWRVGWVQGLVFQPAWGVTSMSAWVGGADDQGEGIGN